MENPIQNREPQMTVCIVYEDDHVLLQQLRQSLSRRSISTTIVGIYEVSAIINERTSHSLKKFDVIYFDRATEMVPHFGTQIALLSHIETLGVRFINSPKSWLKARNKATMTTVLTQAYI